MSMHLDCQLAKWDVVLYVIRLFVVTGLGRTFTLEGFPHGSEDEKDVYEPGRLCPGRSERWAAQQERI